MRLCPELEELLEATLEDLRHVGFRAWDVRLRSQGSGSGITLNPKPQTLYPKTLKPKP